MQRGLKKSRIQKNENESCSPRFSILLHCSLLDTTPVPKNPISHSPTHPRYYIPNLVAAGPPNPPHPHPILILTSQYPTPLITKHSHKTPIPTIIGPNLQHIPEPSGLQPSSYTQTIRAPTIRAPTNQNQPPPPSFSLPTLNQVKSSSTTPTFLSEKRG